MSAPSETPRVGQVWEWAVGGKGRLPEDVKHELTWVSNDGRVVEGFAVKKTRRGKRYGKKATCNRSALKRRIS